MAGTQTPQLYICVTCTGNDIDGRKPGDEYDAAGKPRPGRRLYDATVAAAEAAAQGVITVRPVKCLGNCSQGCSAAMAGAGKWGYLLGQLTEQNAADLVAYGAAYAETDSGMVMRKNRPESLHQAIMSRFPVPGDAPDADGFLAKD